MKDEQVVTLRNYIKSYTNHQRFARLLSIIESINQHFDSEIREAIALGYELAG